MSLRLPSEIVVDRVLPTLRAMLAVELADRGLTQEQVAGRIGVSQAAVSKYAGGTIAGEPRIREDDRAQETIARVADGLAEGTMDGYDALAELLDLIEAMEDRGPICHLHEEAMPALEGLGCDLCVRGSDPELRAERAALSDVRRAARLLAAAPGMAEAVPNVGTNVGAALSDAADVSDVAAVPGRIHVVGGRVQVPADPEFGASEHVATAILAAAAADPAVGGGLNLATADALLDAARDRGIDPLEFDPDYDDRGDRLRERLGEAGVPRVIFHRGAYGIEPITYVFGGTAVEAAELAASLVEAAFEGGPP